MLFWGSSNLAVRAKTQNRCAFNKHAFITDWSAVNYLHVGDVLISKSGNYRLIIRAFMSDGERVISFLSWLKNGRLDIQSTVESRIDSKKIHGVVRRIDCSPLVNFSALIQKISRKSNFTENLAVLLGISPLGIQFKRAMRIGKRNKSGLTKVSAELSEDFNIKQILNPTDPVYDNRVDYVISKVSNDEDEYISKIEIYGDIPVNIKQRHILTIIFANLFSNAKMLVSTLEAS